MIASLSGGSLIKGLIAGVVGFMVATIGTDPVSGVPRFTFGEPDLLTGIRPILVMVGLFAVSEMLGVVSPSFSRKARQTTRLLPSQVTSESTVQAAPMWAAQLSAIAGPS